MIKFFSSLLLLVLIILPFFASAQSKSTLHLKITNLENTDGQLIIFVHHGPEGFPRKGMYKVVKTSNLELPSTSVTIEGIPYGGTAISVLHDENNSGKMDFNWAHFPAEKFGFYKYYKVKLMEPSYEDVEFQVDSPEMELEIIMQ